jgi:hypothetical protein
MTDQVSTPVRISPDAGLDEMRNYLRQLHDWLESREPVAAGSELTKFVPFEALTGAGLLAYSTGSSTGYGGGFVPGPAAGPGDELDYLEDLRAPDSIAGLVVTPGIDFFLVEFTAPTYTQGGGNQYTDLYAANYSGTGPLPTFGDAVPVFRCFGALNIAAIPAEPGVQTHFWAGAVTRAGVRQVDGAGPTGGTNGVYDQTGQDVTSMLDVLTAAAEDPLAHYSKFAVRTDLFYVGDAAGTFQDIPFFVATTSFTQNGLTVPAGVYMTSAFISDGTIDTAKIGLLAVTTAKIADAAIATAKIGDAQVTTAKIVDANITTAKIADANITTAKIANLAVTAAQIANATITDAQVASLNADKITAGAIRGINVNAASHTTVGSYLTTAASAADTTLNVKDTTDFPASGSAVFLDTTNDRDAITYTGKTATTLTGCSGVLAHNNGATIVPLQKAMVIDRATNEMRFFGDRGDGTVEELAAVGITSSGGDNIIAQFGSQNSGNGRVGVRGMSYSSYGVQGFSTTSYGGLFTSASGAASVLADSFLGSGFGLYARGNATSAPIGAAVLVGRPTSPASGSFAFVNTTGGSTDNRTGTPRWIFADGTDWRYVHDNSVFTG